MPVRIIPLGATDAPGKQTDARVSRLCALRRDRCTPGPEDPMPSPSAAGGCPFTDPQHLFADLAATRAADGLPYSEVFDARVVSRSDDIVAALHDPETFSATPTVPEMPSPWRERFAGRVPSRGTLLGLDNPDHDRLRSAVNTFFMPPRPPRFEPWIEAAAHDLVDGFAREGKADLKRSFGLPLA